MGDLSDYNTRSSHPNGESVLTLLAQPAAGHLPLNRSRERVNQIGVEDDVEAVRAWLHEYRDEPRTYRAYRREAERLLLWVRTEGMTVSALSRADFNRYHAFLLDPLPRASWCGRRVAKFTSEGLPNPDWRPFVGPLTPASAKQALRILNSLFSYLVKGGFLDGNPLAIMKAPRRARLSERRTGRAQKVMDARMVRAIWQAIDALPAETSHDRRAQARTRWLMVCGFYLGARISELAEHSMGSFRRNHDPDGKTRWWWHAHGKGGKLGTVPLPDQFVDELRLYREAMGFAPLPTPGDSTPMIGTVDGGRFVTARRLHQIFQGVIWAAADLIEESAPNEASVLRRATPHWMRHSYITQLLDSGKDLTLASENARHDSIETTMIYVHRNDRQRHDATRDLSWPSYEVCKNP